MLGDDWDDIDGVVHVKKAMAVPHERRKDVPVSALMSDRLVVPETIRLDPLLRELREGGFQMAVVVDEYGGTSASSMNLPPGSVTYCLPRYSLYRSP